MQPLAREEQETVIRCSAVDKVWDIVTADTRVKTKLKNAGYIPHPDHQLGEPFEGYEIPFAALSFRSLKGMEAKREAAIKAGWKPPRHGDIPRQTESKDSGNSETRGKDGIDDQARSIDVDEDL